jgi:integral membrane protein (TIGR01906 family)
MTSHRMGAAILHIVLLVCAPIALLLSNLYLVATPAYIRYQYGRASFPPSTQYDAQARLELAEATLRYMRSAEDSTALRRLEWQGWPVYNEREIQHLVDAKNVMRGAFLVQGVGALVAIAAVALAWRRADALKSALQGISNGSLLLFAVLVAIGTVAYTNFGVFFTMFHKLFFLGDSWLFPRTDTLIQLFPVPFWMDATFILAGLTLVECLVVALISRWASARVGATK